MFLWGAWLRASGLEFYSAVREATIPCFAYAVLSWDFLDREDTHVVCFLAQSKSAWRDGWWHLCSFNVNISEKDERES
jgi:hypothetical protein